MADVKGPSRRGFSAPVSLGHYRHSRPVQGSPLSGEARGAEGAAMPTVQAPGEWAVPVEAYCLHCGYDLRGLPVGRPCSECGKAVDWAGHAERVRRYYAGGVARTLWDMLNFFCVLPHGLWAMDDPAGRGWRGRRWRWYAAAALAVLAAGIAAASGGYVRSTTRVWYEKEGEATAPVTVLVENTKWLGGWGLVQREPARVPPPPGAGWDVRQAVERTFGVSGAGVRKDGAAFLALYCPLFLAAAGMWPMRRLILWFSVMDGSQKTSRAWIRERLSPAWLGFGPAAMLVLAGMAVQATWSMWPAWVPDKAKELAAVWLPNAALLVPPYLVMRILSADYTRRLFANRWALGWVTLGCLVVGPWTAGQALFWVMMASMYSVGSPISRLPALWGF